MKRPFQIRLSKHLNCIWAGRGGDWGLEEGGWDQGYTVAKCKTRTLSPGWPTSRKVCFSSESQLWLLSHAATGMWELFCLEAGYSYSWNQILQSVSQLTGKASLKFFFFFPRRPCDYGDGQKLDGKNELSSKAYVPHSHDKEPQRQQGIWKS